MSRFRKPSKPSKAKTATLLLLLVILSTTSSIILSIYPQHIFIDNQTTFPSVKFADKNTAIIRGNAVQYGTEDIIPLAGREYIKITGNQQQFGDNIFTPAIRMLSTTIWQNTLFERSIGSFDINRNVAQVQIDEQLINIIPISQNILKIKTTNSDYNIELTQGISYVSSKDDVLLKFSKNGNVVTIFLVGIKNYDSINVNVIGG